MILMPLIVIIFILFFSGLIYEESKMWSFVLLLLGVYFIIASVGAPMALV